MGMNAFVAYFAHGYECFCGFDVRFCTWEL